MFYSSFHAHLGHLLLEKRLWNESDFEQLPFPPKKIRRCFRHLEEHHLVSKVVLPHPNYDSEIWWYLEPKEIVKATKNRIRVVLKALRARKVQKDPTYHCLVCKKHQTIFGALSLDLQCCDQTLQEMVHVPEDHGYVKNQVAVLQGLHFPTNIPVSVNPVRLFLFETKLKTAKNKYRESKQVLQKKAPSLMRREETREKRKTNETPKWFHLPDSHTCTNKFVRNEPTSKDEAEKDGAVPAGQPFDPGDDTNKFVQKVGILPSEEPGVALASIPSQQLANTEEPDEEDEIMVSVKGRQIPFTEVTASMESEMTLDEYNDYFELCSDLY